MRPKPPSLPSLSKGSTPADVLPRHIGHEDRSARLLKTVCQRLRVPNDCAELASGRRVAPRPIDTAAASANLITLSPINILKSPNRFPVRGAL